MTKEETLDAIIRLNASLKMAGLNWVVQEVSSVVERGVEEPKEVAFESFDQTSKAAKKPGRRTLVTITRPLTEIEELQLLVDAVRAVIVDTYELQQSALLRLKQMGVESPEVAFRPETVEGFESKGYSVPDDKQGHAFEWTASEAQLGSAHLKHLKTVIEKLTEIIHAD
mgnify:CR=1 FL=1